jgi:hypothetical protein
VKKSQSVSKTGILSVQAADAGTEIFVMNARFERVASGVNRLEAAVAPGIYKVRFRVGTEMRDVLTEVSQGPTPTVVTTTPLQFAAAAPIAQTTTAPDFQRDSAQLLSRPKPGTNLRSKLMLFVRDPQDAVDDVELRSVQVRMADGAEIVGDGLIQTDDASKRYTGWNRPVAPGVYRVRVETGAKGSYEMFVHASQGWQTLVFLVAEDFPYRGRTIRRPALRSATVMMSGAGGFDAEDPRHRLAEQAKAALQYGRPAIWSGVVGELVKSKFTNPMLGIFGLHLGLLAPKVDRPLLATVVKNMTGIVPHHPDVECVRLDSRLPANLRDRSMTFPDPPMLRSSWNLIVRATVKHPSMVPAGSLFDSVADNQLQGGPWLIARVPEEIQPAPAFLDGQFARAKFTELYRLVNDSGRRKSLRERIADPHALTVVQRNLLLAAVEWVDEEAADGAHPLGRPLTLPQVIDRLKVPACTIARTAAFLTEWAT